MVANNSNGSAPHDDLQGSRDERRGPWRSKHPLARGLAIGLLAAILFTVGLALFRARQTIPRLTETAYREAVARWQQNGPADYDLDLEIGGNRPGPVHIEVRGGEVTRMTRDGIVPSQKRTWDYWSVNGQLETIGQELEMSQDPARSFGAAGAAEVVMWAEFDAHYGYPRRYDRVVLGADLEVHWKVTRFEPIAPKN